MQRIDIATPLATPFRPNWATAPRVDISFKTDVFTAADGRETRSARAVRPRLTVSYECAALSQAHALRASTALRNLSAGTLAIRDFRLNGEAMAAPGSPVLHMPRSVCAWPAGTLVVIEDDLGLVEQAARIQSWDPVSGILTLDAPLSDRFVAGHGYAVGSAMACSLEDATSAEVYTAGALKISVNATSYPQAEAIAGVAGGVFPLRHGDPAAISVESARVVTPLDYGFGNRLAYANEAIGTSGNRTYEITSYQLDQSQKEALFSFYTGCLGRLLSFRVPDGGALPGILMPSPNQRFRFASDTLAIEHITGAITKSTVRIMEVIA